MSGTLIAHCLVVMRALNRTAQWKACAAVIAITLSIGAYVVCRQRPGDSPAWRPQLTRGMIWLYEVPRHPCDVHGALGGAGRIGEQRTRRIDLAPVDGGHATEKRFVMSRLHSSYVFFEIAGPFFPSHASWWRGTSNAVSSRL